MILVFINLYLLQKYFLSNSLSSIFAIQLEEFGWPVPEQKEVLY